MISRHVWAGILALAALSAAPAAAQHAGHAAHAAHGGAPVALMDLPSEPGSAAFAAIAAKRGREASAFPQKGIYYLGGLTEGFETIVIFLLMCLLPGRFPILACIFAAACALTTVLRWRMGWKTFGRGEP